ncbi:hypothetical protein RJ640_017926 [Escallonia rubra]|uniref:Uncharacterized protein n=1 Tax=Escallonia rubra TaxID=112253 RepID=A0AA88QKZ9_9ASTE|nr:hypothetical protein RJ640_017926 [Escallonia rubra]
MFPSSSNGFPLADSTTQAPSAPPPPPLSPPMPLSFDYDYPNPIKPTVGTPVNMPSNSNQNNPTNPPAAARNLSFRSRSPVPWSTGLCGCSSDFSSWEGRACGVSGALYMLILCVTGCSCLYSCFYRSKLRGQYFLEESPCTDCCAHCCCEECALCQEYRELQNQGFDMSIGLSLLLSPSLCARMHATEEIDPDRVAWKCRKAETSRQNGSTRARWHEALEHNPSVSLPSKI